MRKEERHYLKCKDTYSKETKQDNSNISIYDLTLKTNPFPTDQIYLDQILSIKNKLDTLYQDKTKYFNTSGLSSCLNDVFSLEKELKIIINKYLVPYLEKNIFGCYVEPQKIKVYKTVNESLKEKLSWLWHFDNNIEEEIKVMIYFNNVDNNGPFKYLSKDNEAIKIEPTNSRHSLNRAINWFKVFDLNWKGTRVPKNIISSLKEKYNCKEVEVKGPLGTSILFDNNILHKGTIPFEGFRYAMTLAFKPVDKKIIKWKY